MRRPNLGTWIIFLLTGVAASALAAQPAPAGVAGSGAAILTPERAAALAVNTLEAVDGGFSLRNPRHRASFTAGGVTVSPRSGSPSWSWRLTRVGPAASQVSLIGGAPVTPARAEAGIVRYARGMLDEEYQLEAGAIEQRFVLHAPLPLDGGGLVLEGVVACDAAFSAANGGWEWRGERGVVRLGPATVIDANGAILPSSFEVSAGATRLIVEAGALAGATYPVTIDLEIRGYELRISDMGGTGDPYYNARDPAVAYNSTNNEYLVVWYGDDEVGGMVAGEYEIFGQRLDATGAAVGANDFRLSEMGGTGDDEYDAELPAVAYNSTNNQYLVVWCGDKNVSGLVDNEYEIFGQRLDATGTAVGTNDFRISGMGGTGDPAYDAQEPAVAYNSTNNEYLVVWYGNDNVGGLIGGELEIFGQRLNAATGIAVGAEDFRISDMGGTGDPDYDASKPAVSYNSTDNEYLAVWYGEDDVAGLVDEEREIFGQRLDAATGAELGANDFRISDMGGTGDPDYGAWYPRVAYNSTNQEYLVVWHGNDNVGGLHFMESEIFGQRLDTATGAELGTNDFRISEMGGTGDPEYTAVYTSVASNSGNNQYLAVWNGDDNTGGLVDNEFEIFGKMLGILPFEDGFESGDTGAWSTTVP